jgi:hypothetical protein
MDALSGRRNVRVALWFERRSLEGRDMAYEQKIAKAFNLTDDNWMRHANPWSVWTRYSVLPVIIAAFWSRVWISWWAAIPAAIAILWMFLNPIFFAKASSTRNWASRAVLGERVWLARDTVAVPEHHRVLPHFLNLVSSFGMVVAIWGIVALNPTLAVFGTIITMVGKSWYLDRMVWLYGEMKAETEEYSSWDF